MPYLRNSIACDHYFWYTCVNEDISRCCFQFFKILIFQVFQVRGQETVQNDKKFCQSCFISCEPYIMWLSFMVDLCKMIISAGVFFSFSKFWFSGSIWGLKDKKCSRMTKYSVCRTPYLRIHTSYDCHLCLKCVKW